MTKETKGGFTLLWRRTLKSHYLMPPGHVYTRLEAWLDIENQLTRYTDNGVLKRGQFRGSLRFLARRWNWSTSRVQRFLSDLEEQGEIERVPERVGHFALCHYETSQAPQRHEKLEVSDQAEQVIQAWNALGPVPVRQRTRGLIRAVEEALETHSVEELSTAFFRYRDVLSDPDCYLEKRWSLYYFLTRKEAAGVAEFLGRQWRGHFVRFKNETALFGAVIRNEDFEL